MSLRARAISQGIWGMVNIATIRVIAFLAQIVLAVLLAPSDFGIYAVAMAGSTIALTVRGAGVTQWQIEGGERKHHERGVDAFWLALVWNIVLGAAVAAGARPLAALFQEPEVATLIVVIGLTFPLQTPATYYFARLQIQLRLKDLTIIELSSIILRSAVMIGAALLGFGVYSFIIPIPLCFLLEGVMGYVMVREAPWRRTPNWRRWGRILRSTGWVMCGTAGTAIGLQGDYVVLGSLAPIATVGVYYFAYQLTLQTAGLVATNVNRVFTSALVFSDVEVRERRFLRATEFIMLAGSPTVLLLGSAMVPFERLVWGDKWEEAILAVVYLSFGLPLYVLATAVQSRLLSHGQFRRWMLVNLAKAACVVGAAFLAGAYGGGAESIAAIMAVGLAAAHTIQIGLGMHGSGIPVAALVRASWIGVVLAPAALLASYSLIVHLSWSDLAELFLGPLVMLGLYGAALFGLRPRFVAGNWRALRTRLSN